MLLSLMEGDFSSMIDVSTIDKYLLLHGDCMVRMKEIPDGSIELILCDPPIISQSIPQAI